MSGDADRLNELIARVLDGKTIDWAGAESSALDSEEHLSVTALRDVARIAGFSRDLQRAGTASPGAGVDAGVDASSEGGAAAGNDASAAAGVDASAAAGDDASAAAGGDASAPAKPERTTLGDLAMLLCSRAEAEERGGDRAAASAAFRAAEILTDQVGATPGSPLRSRIDQLRTRMA